MGNKLGWILAGSLVLGLVLAIILFATREDLTGPTHITLAPGVLDFHAPDLPVSSVAGFTPSAAGDAGADYAQALASMRADLSTLENSHAALAEKYKNTDEKDPMYLKKWGELDASAVSALERIHSHIAAGARKKDCFYVLNYGPKEFHIAIGYDNYPFFVDTARIRGWMGMLKDCYAARGEFGKAEALLKDTFVMGWHLMNERAMLQETKVGLGIQDACCKDLMALSKLSSSVSAAGARKYVEAMDTIRTYNSVKENVLAQRTPHIGDTLNILEHDQDRGWRVQAILVLGNLKYVGSTEASAVDDKGAVVMKRDDTRKVFRLLEEYSNDPDPMLSRAAKWASALTKAQRDELGRKG